METRPADLPDFKNPPLTEIVLSLQFDPIEGLSTPYIGVLWNHFRERLPLIEEQPPLLPTFERFEMPAPPSVEVVFEDKPPIRRVWFLNDEKTELVQIQPDRFIHNWRKVSGQEIYPRYESIRDKFRQEVDELADFLSKEKLGSLKINQCEVTYINHIEASGVWENHGQLDRILRYWNNLSGTTFLPEPEDISARVRYIIPDDQGKPIGRLNAIMQSGRKKKDNSPVYILNLTARGSPLSDDITGAFRFFNLGRNWIVKGFSEITTEVMQQKVWRRIK